MEVGRVREGDGEKGRREREGKEIKREEGRYKEGSREKVSIKKIRLSLTSSPSCVA